MGSLAQFSLSTIVGCAFLSSSLQKERSRQERITIAHQEDILCKGKYLVIVNENKKCYIQYQEDTLSPCYESRKEYDKRFGISDPNILIEMWLRDRYCPKE